MEQNLGRRGLLGCSKVLKVWLMEQDLEGVEDYGILRTGCVYSLNFLKGGGTPRPPGRPDPPTHPAKHLEYKCVLDMLSFGNLLVFTVFH